jgi:major membrane immunogen (membrane-anchored lipoprotein)
MSRWIVTLLVSLVLLGGCGKKDEAGGGEAPASGEAIGVEECDDYFKKAEACMSKVPADTKTAMESAIKANRAAWRDVAKNAANKDALKVGCKATLDAFVASNPTCQ